LTSENLPEHLPELLNLRLRLLKLVLHLLDRMPQRVYFGAEFSLAFGGRLA
jgi:hypothetical protein